MKSYSFDNVEERIRNVIAQSFAEQAEKQSSAGGYNQEFLDSPSKKGSMTYTGAGGQTMAETLHRIEAAVCSLRDKLQVRRKEGRDSTAARESGSGGIAAQNQAPGGSSGSYNNSSVAYPQDVHLRPTGTSSTMRDGSHRAALPVSKETVSVTYDPDEEVSSSPESFSRGGEKKSVKTTGSWFGGWGGNKIDDESRNSRTKQPRLVKVDMMGGSSGTINTSGGSMNINNSSTAGNGGIITTTSSPIDGEVPSVTGGGLTHGEPAKVLRRAPSQRGFASSGGGGTAEGEDAAGGGNIPARSGSRIRLEMI